MTAFNVHKQYADNSHFLRIHYFTTHESVYPYTLLEPAICYRLFINDSEFYRSGTVI